MGITDSFPRNWECARCTYANTFMTFSSQCQICGYDRDAQLWICCSCGASNPAHIVLCNSCGSEQNTFTGRKKNWRCPKCSCINFPDSINCSVCQTNKSSKSQVKSVIPIAVEVDSSRLRELQKDVLKCHKCKTLLYDNTDINCTVCGVPCLAEGFKPRPFPQSSLPKLKAEDQPSSSGLWKCSTCTLLNDPAQTICQACGSKKGDKPGEKLRPLGR